MKVCLVTPYSWSFPGGVLEHVDALAVHLERRGHEVRVMAPNDPLDLRTRLLHPKLGRHGDLPERVIPVGRSVPLPSNGSLANLAFSPAVFRKVRRSIARYRSDVVHVHEPLLPPVGWAAVRAAKSLGIPLVGTFHAHYPGGCYHYRLFKKALEPFFRALDARIAVSPTAARTAAEHFPGYYRVIPNGVDVERFRPANTPRNPDEVLFVGRRDGRKGLPVLLRAFPKVLERRPEARLVIVGSRPGEVKLPKSLLSSVEVRGVVDEREIVRAMHSASLLCVPSTGAESFGIVLIEALAAGLPVLASDIPGYRAVVTPGHDGVLVPPGDPDVLAGALTGLLADDELRARLSEAGLRTARRYDWPNVAEEVASVYETVSRRPSAVSKNPAL
ncbi:MAG: glycosyltransferase family 4 protein [Actinomycetota bacterium]|nr:glycosyltransferase family 4 protein [Actinomycetota bacterium]